MSTVKVMPVSGGTNTKKLGSALSREFKKTDVVELRAIGVQAVNQACKGIAQANSFLGAEGRLINTVVGFFTVDSENSDDKEKSLTAIKFLCSLK